jgi:hypothetical protein
MRVLGVAFLLLLAMLSGCTSQPEGDAGAGATGPHIVTRPDDVAARQNGTGEHIHDYWGGQDRLRVLEKTIQTGCGGCISVMQFRPDPRTVVPQGTASIEMAVSWTQQLPSYYDPMRLLLKTAADNEPVDMGPVDNGETLVFPVTLEQSDLPHQVLSAWEFNILLSGTPLASFFGSITVTATAVRGLEIPPFPAHPDHWQGRTEIPLFDGSQTVAQILIGGALIGTSFNTFHPGDGILVPDGTQIVRVELEQGASETPLGLQFHGADAWEWSVAEAVSDTGTRKVYEIPVGGLAADGPYAKQSLWEFRVFVDLTTPAAPYAGSYSLSATAVRSPDA